MPYVIELNKKHPSIKEASRGRLFLNDQKYDYEHLSKAVTFCSKEAASDYLEFDWEFVSYISEEQLNKALSTI